MKRARGSASNVWNSSRRHSAVRALSCEIDKAPCLCRLDVIAKRPGEPLDAQPLFDAIEIGRIPDIGEVPALGNAPGVTVDGGQMKFLTDAHRIHKDRRLGTRPVIVIRKRTALRWWRRNSGE